MLTVTFMVEETHFCFVVRVALLILLVKLFKKQTTLSEYIRYKGVPFERVSAFVPFFRVQNTALNTSTHNPRRLCWSVQLGSS